MITKKQTTDGEASKVLARSKGELPAPRQSGWFAEYIGMVIVLLFLLFLFATLSDNFLTRSNLAIMANQAPSLALIALGMTFVLVIGGIDLSVGSIMALSGVMVGVAMADWHWSFWPAAGLGLAAGLACGVVNGAITVIWNIPSFIVTLGMLEIARGLAYLATESKTKYIGSMVEGLGTPVAGVGLSLAFFFALGAVVSGQIVLTRTVFGRYMIAVGANEQATRLSGIDPRPVKIAVFALSGLLSGLGGLFYCSRLSSADPNAGVGLELSAIAAVVIGGTSLMGGRGSVVNSFFGVLIIVILRYGLAQVGASDPTKRLITGLVIVVAVIADAWRQKRTEKRG